MTSMVDGRLSMTTSTKQKLTKSVNFALVAIIITGLVTVYGYVYNEQRSQAKELGDVKEEIIVLKQTSAQVLSQSELIKGQRKQIDINTKSLAVLETEYKGINNKLDFQYKALDSKLTLIYDLVRDNNYAIYQHMEKSK